MDKNRKMLNVSKTMNKDILTLFDNPSNNKDLPSLIF